MLPFRQLVFVTILAVGSLFVSTSAHCGSGSAACPNGFTYGYPFTQDGDLSRGNGDCGYPGLSFNCSRDKPKPVMNISNHMYYVNKINTSDLSLEVVDIEVYEEECPRHTQNFTFQIELETASAVRYFYDYNIANVTYFYNCSSYPENVVQHLPCLDAYYNSTTNSTGLRSFAFSAEDIPDDGFNWYANCEETVVVPVGYISNDEDYKEGLLVGFGLSWSVPEECKYCENSGGKCWYNATTTVRPFCACQDGPNITIFDTICPQGAASTPQIPPAGTTNIPVPNLLHAGTPKEQKIITGVLSGIIGGVFLVMLFVCRRRLSVFYNYLKYKIIKTPTDVEAFLETSGCSGLKKYKYSQIKKMTNSFKELLGRGGFASVFKGKLSDGRLVAVKVLNESKSSGEDFINEVATIGTTNHVNVVRLLGFCSNGNKRALVYEFMVNGSLEKFIYSAKNKSRTNPALGYDMLYQIAVGISRGLEYLHCGCNNRILHFDIKPHNILLDQDFRPKISDFGLAKLCQTGDSLVSMHEARGTIGYIAPEFVCTDFGGVSHKSDVYSFGMLILEMIGRRKNMDPTMENTSEINFPSWIYNHINQDIVTNEFPEIYSDETIRKMIIVALWSIQDQPADRPSISKIVEMLEGKVDELQIPPNPTVSSP